MRRIAQMTLLILILTTAPSLAGNYTQIFNDGDPIVGAEYVDGEYARIAPEMFIDLTLSLDKHSKRITVFYQSWLPKDIVGWSWAYRAATYVLTDEQALAGLTWADVLPDGDKHIHFEAKDLSVKAVSIAAESRDAGVPNTLQSFGTLKADWK